MTESSSVAKTRNITVSANKVVSALLDSNSVLRDVAAIGAAPAVLRQHMRQVAGMVGRGTIKKFRREFGFRVRDNTVIVNCIFEYSEGDKSLDFGTFQVSVQSIHLDKNPNSFVVWMTTNSQFNHTKSVLPRFFEDLEALKNSELGPKFYTAVFGLCRRHFGPNCGMHKEIILYK